MTNYCDDSLNCPTCTELKKHDVPDDSVHAIVTSPPGLRRGARGRVPRGAARAAARRVAVAQLQASELRGGQEAGEPHAGAAGEGCDPPRVQSQAPGSGAGMKAAACQRWRDGRASYRPADETINWLEYEVAPIAGDNPYAWGLRRATKRVLGPSNPTDYYPKKRSAA